jgi:two-component system chemotaxis response regulator CheB
MNTRNIIVIGASAGGFDALKKLVADLPEDFQASIFIVWHLASDAAGVLPEVLNRSKTIFAANAVDGEAIAPNRIYVAPPDHHLLIERDRILVTKGPKENRFRPAVDPLFRSAAYAYGAQVIGVILSGSLDDGTSGLWMVKQRGGVAVVQHPLDAEVPSMPRNAMREVEIDHSVPISEMADLLIRLTKEPLETSEEAMMEEDGLTEVEIGIAAEKNAFESGIISLGELSPFTCPECHGVMVKFREGGRERYRCHTGHAFSADSLLATISENIEQGLYSTLRGFEESVMLLNNLGNYFSEVKNNELASLYFGKAVEVQERSKMLKQIILRHEQINQEILERKAENGSK